MAENKRSFLLYADLIHTVRKMSNEQAGKLIKTILSYVNDENPIVEDIIVDFVFEPVKQQLKRDLKHWEGVKEKRSEAGKIGGIKSGKTRLKQKEANEANALKSKQKEANEAVNVNVNVNVVDEAASSLFSILNFDQQIQIGINEFTLHATRQTKRSNEDLIKFKSDFLIECKSLSKLSWPNATDAKRHFISWVKKQPEAGVKINRHSVGN